MGKIGLPLAVQYARKGHFVSGIDINQQTVELINCSKEPFPGETHLAEYLKEVVDSNNLIASTDTKSAVSHSDVVVIVVPLYIDNKTNPDFFAVDAATQEVAKGLKKKTLVIFETTLPVGTTRNRLTPLLETGSGLQAGKDFYVVFSPERVLSGRIFADLRKYPKLVGGINQQSECAGINFYEEVLDFDTREDLPQTNGVWAMGSLEAAELAKLAETTYRDVNIALANQFAIFAEKNQIDFYAVQKACNSQPFSHIHSPGIAVGGHCIPVYPKLYLWNDPFATVVENAREVNLSMPKYVVNRIENEVGSLIGLKVAVLGASYRGGVKETAFSGIYPVVKNLTSKGAVVFVHDPLFSSQEIVKLGFSPYVLGENIDVAVIQADHEEYVNISPKDIPGAKLIFDGRNILDTNFLDKEIKVLKLGKPYVLKHRE